MDAINSGCSSVMAAFSCNFDVFFSPDDFDVIHNFYFFQAAEWLIFYCVLGMGITNLCIYIYYICILYIYTNWIDKSSFLSKVKSADKNLLM